LLRNPFDLLSLFFVDRFAPAARHACHRMDAAPAQHLDHVVVAHAAVDHLLADVHAHFVDHAQEIALSLGSVGADHEIWPAQRVEMRGVVGDIEGHVEHLAQFLHCRGWLHMVEHVQRFGGGNVMRFRADATDAVGDAGHLLGGPVHAELFEAAQFGDLEVGVGDVALIVEEYLDLAMSFQAGDRVYCDSFHNTASLFAPLVFARRNNECAMLKR